MPTLASPPEPVQAKQLKRKQFASNGDVHILGDVQITTQMLVGGDLLVDGDLQAEEVFCLGKLTVTGNIQVQSLYVGQALDCGGDIEVEFLLKTGCSADWMARMLELDQAKPAKDGSPYMDKLVHPAILQRNSHQEVFGGYGDIQALGYLACDVLDCHGDVQLDGVFDVVEVQYLGGHLTASEIEVAGDCNCKGEMFSETDITVAGSLFAATVTSEGNLDCGALHSLGDISCWGYLRASEEISSLNGEIHCGRWIATKGSIFAAKYIKAGESVVAEKGISCGDDYGILAATSLRRSRWEKLGMVSAPKQPDHLLSGKFVAGKKRSHVDALEKKRDWELDWEIPRRLKREAELG
ncbi:hypothetical protein [Undibacterium sp. Ren11W]|uniref:hypothetical protein n=1 Tax=Undibacterium sp. Ren11W TaxID=3413045 RepID=UPI003BEFFF21